MLGGFSRREIRTYNTCAGTGYMKKGVGQTSANYELEDPGAPRDGRSRPEYDDLNAFMHRADELAESLLEEGVSAMKIWPFDLAAERSGGVRIDKADLKTALEPFEKIRRAVGDRMDIMVEFHSMWQLLPAIEIARALEPYAVYWHEDPIRMDSLESLARYADATDVPLCASETLATRWGFKDLLQTGAAGVLNLDVSWCGGLSEARAIAAMAEAWHLPIAPHDCTGPVALTAATHLSLHAPNALFQESVRAFHRTWYADIVTALPPIENGHVTVPPGAGLAHGPCTTTWTRASRSAGVAAAPADPSASEPSGGRAMGERQPVSPKRACSPQRSPLSSAEMRSRSSTSSAAGCGRPSQ